MSIGLTGVWQHVKGPRYLVLGVASDSNNVSPHTEPQVVYVSIDSDGRTPDTPIHIRSLTEFLQRFHFVGVE